MTEAQAKPVLVLRTCNADMTSHGGFRWPESGPVEAPDWNPDPSIECGKGLHGLLWGSGDGSLLDWRDGARWLLVSVIASDIRESSGKVRFPRGTVVYCGDRSGAIARLQREAPVGTAIVGTTVAADNFSTATAGDHGTATAGCHGTVMIRCLLNGRPRVVTGYIGEAGLEPNTPYRLDSSGRFTESK